MNANAQWRWEFLNQRGFFSGYVDAADPRDAVSRMLTQKASSGGLFGEAHRVPVDVIQRAPGNGDAQFEIVDERFKLRVRRIG